MKYILIKQIKDDIVYKLDEIGLIIIDLIVIIQIIRF